MTHTVLTNSGNNFWTFPELLKVLADETEAFPNRVPGETNPTCRLLRILSNRRFRRRSKSRCYCCWGNSPPPSFWSNSVDQIKSIKLGRSNSVDQIKSIKFSREILMTKLFLSTKMSQRHKWQVDQIMLTK